MYASRNFSNAATLSCGKTGRGAGVMLLTIILLVGTGDKDTMVSNNLGVDTNALVEMDEREDYRHC